MNYKTALRTARKRALANKQYYYILRDPSRVGGFACDPYPSAPNRVPGRLCVSAYSQAGELYEIDLPGYRVNRSTGELEKDCG